jgi:putative endonuclease
MFYVYAIRSLVRAYIYVGLTNIIERRLDQHNKGENRSTKAYKPFKLIYSEMLQTRK